MTRSVKHPSASKSNHGSKRHSREKLGQGVQLLITAKLQLRLALRVESHKAGLHIKAFIRLLPSILHASLGWAETLVGGSQALVHEELGAAELEGSHYVDLILARDQSEIACRSGCGTFRPWDSAGRCTGSCRAP